MASGRQVGALEGEVHRVVGAHRRAERDQLLAGADLVGDPRHAPTARARPGTTRAGGRAPRWGRRCPTTTTPSSESTQKKLTRPCVDQVLHRVDHAVVAEVLGPAGLAGEDQHRPAPVAVADHAETVVRPRHRQLDALSPCTASSSSYASNLARHR